MLYAWFQDKNMSRAVLKPAIAIVVLFVFSWGASTLSNHHYESHKKTIQTVKLALLQGNIAQDVKWDPKLAKQILRKYVQLNDRAINDGADIILWPETSYPYGILEKKMKTQKFLRRSSFPVPLLVGAVNVHKDQNGKKIYNSVFQVDQEASFQSVYRKMHLVPFGEYLPFRKYLKFMESFAQGVGFFNAGDKYVLFDILNVKWAPLICVEDIYSRYAREFAKRGANVLVNFTNDAWYGDSPMQRQHLFYSQFRALENRRPLVRVTNTGYTAIIDATGKVIKDFPQNEEGNLYFDLKIENGPSFYTTYGDSWILVIVLAGVGLVIRSFLFKSQTRPALDKR